MQCGAGWRALCITELMCSLHQQLTWLGLTEGAARGGWAAAVQHQGWPEAGCLSGQVAWAIAPHVLHAPDEHTQ